MFTESANNKCNASESWSKNVIEQQTQQKQNRNNKGLPKVYLRHQ